MYLGLLLCLIGWSLWLENIMTIGGAVVFYWYINKYQIPFEEAALAEKFTEKFQSFCAKTRRWL
jgi:protein-S-isoprenylcysteine O-methyltransferase Ste14